jgi:hypothetical protein
VRAEISIRKVATIRPARDARKNTKRPVAISPPGAVFIVAGEQSSSYGSRCDGAKERLSGEELRKARGGQIAPEALAAFSGVSQSEIFSGSTNFRGRPFSYDMLNGK